jgi:hypothetical protein
MLTVIESRNEISDAQEALRRGILALSSETVPVTIGFQSGQTPADVYWCPSLGFWAFFGEPPFEKSPGERYWNVFGLGRPSGLVSIACEINSPKSGINRQAAGAFARSHAGSSVLLHRGVFTAGGRIAMSYTRPRFRWQWVEAIDGPATSDFLLIGEIGAASFPRSLCEFIQEVLRFKAAARHRASTSGQPPA